MVTHVPTVVENPVVMSIAMNTKVLNFVRTV